MSFTKIYAGLVLLGIVPILIGSFIGGGFYIFIIYNLILAALYFVDFFITPATNMFDFQRECDEKFSLGAENEVTINIRNNSNYLINIKLTDTIPDYFNSENRIVNVEVMPHRENKGSFFVVPVKRGKFTFGNIFFKYNGILKLCVKQGEYKLSHDYKVYPNLKDMRKYTLKAMKKINMFQGNRNIRKFGIGTEFESLKEYTDGDDYRKINWLATSRNNKIIVNTYEPERNQNIFILIDSSRVMNSEINNIKKLDYSINSAFVLTNLALNNGDNVGLMVFNNNVKRFIKPGKGVGQFELIAENLYDIHEDFVSSDYDEALKYLNSYQKRRSLLCIFTEPLSIDETMNLVEKIKTYSRRHLPMVISIRDPKIDEISRMKIDSTKDIYLKSSALKLIEDREKIIKIYKEFGIIFVDTYPDKLSIEVLNQYLMIKDRMML